MANRSFSDVLTIMRRVIGEQDGNDPDATAAILEQYVIDFYELEVSQEAELHDLWSYWDFSTVINQDEYTFKDQGFSFVDPVAYLTDSNNATTQMTFWTDPGMFFSIHPLDDTVQTAGRPSDYLLYNDKVTLRPKPDQIYSIKIKAYKELAVPVDGNGDFVTGSDIDQNYYLRWIAYGAAVDYLADHGQHEMLGTVKQLYNSYRAMVMKRTSKQKRSQRPIPAL